VAREVGLEIDVDLVFARELHGGTSGGIAAGTARRPKQDAAVNARMDRPRRMTLGRIE
jgi:hypothetical protein